MAETLSAATGRTTRRFRRQRARLLAESDICALCGHGGADSADHVVARSVDPALAEDEDNLQPMHHEPCPTCGRRCQRDKADRPMAEVAQLKTSRDWFA